MLTTDGIERFQRLSKIQSLLFESTEGLTTKELCKIFGLSQRSIQRDLSELQSPPCGVPLVRNGLKWKIRRKYSPALPSIQLTLTEAMTVLLGLRLVIRRSEYRNPHVLSSLAKLAKVMPAPMSPFVNSIIAMLNKRPGDAASFRVLHSLLTGWVTQRKVRVSFSEESGHGSRECNISPYFIEPGQHSSSMCVVGQVDEPGNVEAIEIEAISKANLTTEGFEMPKGLNVARYSPACRDAGIVATGNDSFELSVRFTAEEAARIDGGSWDIVQEMEKKKDGSCHLTLKMRMKKDLPHISMIETSHDSLVSLNLVTEMSRESEPGVAAIFADGGSS